MKKSYVKPQVYFENFQLSASIAETCGTPVHTHTMGACYFEFGPMKLYITEEVCTDSAIEYDKNNGTCYHNPDSQQSLFASL